GCRHRSARPSALFPHSQRTHRARTWESVVIAELSEVVDELAGVDPASQSDAALASDLLALRAQMDRLEAVFARRADAAHQRGVCAADGAASTAAWLRWRAGMREGEARAAIEAGAV